MGWLWDGYGMVRGWCVYLQRREAFTHDDEATASTTLMGELVRGRYLNSNTPLLLCAPFPRGRRQQLRGEHGMAGSLARLALGRVPPRVEVAVLSDCSAMEPTTRDEDGRESRGHLDLSRKRQCGRVEEAQIPSWLAESGEGRRQREHRESMRESIERTWEGERPC